MAVGGALILPAHASRPSFTTAPLHRAWVLPQSSGLPRDSTPGSYRLNVNVCIRLESNSCSPYFIAGFEPELNRHSLPDLRSATDHRRFKHLRFPKAQLYPPLIRSILPNSSAMLIDSPKTLRAHGSLKVNVFNLAWRKETRSFGSCTPGLHY